MRKLRQSPVRLVILAFTIAVWLGVLLLRLPIASTGPGSATFLEAFFTATSAICVTGLITVDTPTHWTDFGHSVILGLIQIGGLGVMTVATLIGLTVLGKLSVATRMATATETRHLGVGGVRSVAKRIVVTTLVIEVSVAAVLTARFATHYHYDLPRALWHGVFHAISAFNNAGFALYTDSLMGFAADPWICVPIMIAIVTGGLGFPVLAQLMRYRHHVRWWSMNTRIVLCMTGLLLVGSIFFVTALEWGNEATLGPMSWPQKLLAGSFQAVQTRTAGFNSIDIAGLHGATQLGMDLLMFIGGGPAGTAGGIKVTTVAVLIFITWTEIRGETAVNVLGKRLSRSVHRQALAVMVLAITIVFTAIMAIILLSPFRLEPVMFEVLSAFGTVGLSTGITAGLDPLSQLILCMLMFLGRLGPITFAASLALRPRKRMYELPKERPIIG